MMTEELDFEAEIPVLTNVRSWNEVEYSTPNVVKKELVTEDVSDIGEVKRYTREVKRDTRELKNDTGEVEPDTGEGKCDIGKVKSNTGELKSDTKDANIDTGEGKSDTGEVESDTGEIDSDTGEIPDDLEEGELDDDISVQNKTSEVVCWFFQQGTCMYGSQCRNSHVPKMVYNMFDSVLSNRSNLKPFESQNFHIPPFFHPNPMHVMPEIESPWARGIKQAKIVMQNANLRKHSDDLDIENDWQRCLEEAKANIQKASFKRKASNAERPYFDSTYSKQEKCREGSPMKREHESNIKESSKQKYTKIYYSKYENESNYEKRTKPINVKPILDHLKWVDPWQRSKLQRKRTRSMSFSISPSPSVGRSRNRSVSSSSSSSSCFKHIYGSSRKVKSAKKRSRSTSHSASPHSKKGRNSKLHTYSQKHSFSRTVSRSFSKSPRKRLYSGSSSSGSSRKSRKRKKPNDKKGNVKRVSTSSSGKRYIPSERPKNTTLPSVKKTCKRAPSPSNSDSSSSSNLSVSSLSCTSVSSISDINDLPITHSKAREEKTFSKKDQVLQEKKPKETLKLSQKYLENKNLNTSLCRKLSKELDDYSKQKKPSPDRAKLQMHSRVSTKTTSYSDEKGGSQSATSNKIIDQASKPAIVKRVAKQKPSAAAMELLMYHSFGGTDDKANSSSQGIKPSQAKNISLPLDATKSKIKAYLKAPSTELSEVAPSKIASDAQSKSQPIKLTLCASNIKKEAAVSKRKLLLQQLQAIEDAIARKKHPTQ